MVASAYGVGVVSVFSCSDLYLFDVAEAVVFVAFADGEDAVKEVVEFLASGQVVLGAGVGLQYPALLLILLKINPLSSANFYTFVTGLLPAFFNKAGLCC